MEGPAASKRDRRGRGRSLVAAGLLVLILLGVVAIQRSTGRATHSFDSGPVRTDSDTTTSIRVDVGQMATFGGIVLDNVSNHPAVLESIRIDPGLDSGLTLVDVKVAGKERGIGMVGTDREFPPSGIPAEAVRPLPGAIVPPRQVDPEWGIEVFMAFRLNRPGQFGFNHVLVDYKVGGKRHRVRLNDGFIVCGGPDYPRCDVEAFRKSNDD